MTTPCVRLRLYPTTFADKGSLGLDHITMVGPFSHCHLPCLSHGTAPTWIREYIRRAQPRQSNVPLGPPARIHTIQGYRKYRLCTRRCEGRSINPLWVLRRTAVGLTPTEVACSHVQRVWMRWTNGMSVLLCLSFDANTDKLGPITRT